MTTGEVLVLLGIIVGPGGILPFMKQVRRGRAEEGTEQRQSTDNAWLAPIGLIAGVLGFSFAVIAVYFGLSGALPANGAATVAIRVIAGLLGSFAFGASLLVWWSVRDRFLNGTWTTGVAGMLAGFGAFTAMLVMIL